MLKYLLVIGVIAFVYYFFIKKKPLKAPPSSKDAKFESNDMVECHRCGTYCSIEETILSNGEYYCSIECVKES